MGESQPGALSQSEGSGWHGGWVVIGIAQRVWLSETILFKR